MIGGQSRSEDTFDLLRQFLPEIEEEIRQQIQQELQEDHQAHITAQLRIIQQRAQEQYKLALETLHQELGLLKGEKTHQMESQLTQLQQAEGRKEQERLAQAQQKFLQNHFEDRVLGHIGFRQVEQDLEHQVARELSKKWAGVRERRVREVRVRAEGRQQRDRQELDKMIRERVLQELGVKGRKEEVASFRVGLASLKSKYNLKVNTLNRQCQELQQKILQMRHEDAEALVEQMETQLASLRASMVEEQEIEEGQQSSRDGLLLGMVGAGFSLTRPALQGAQFLQEEVELTSEESDQSNQHQESISCFPPPPRQLTDMLYQQDNLTVEECRLQEAGGPLLRWDVGKMVREQWQEDSFDRYLADPNKQNSSMVGNQSPIRSFKALYAEHLRRLNQGLPRRRISEGAKRRILTGMTVFE